jgi:predicted transcriptional regulator
MVVEKQSGPAATKASTGRRMLVGTNVAVAILIVAAICVVAQLFAYDSSRWDMTSSGVNSLGEGTENLLRGLSQNVRLTSLYFETDREDEDQQRYRRAAQNLLDLYEATNRGKVTAEWVNPLKDHEKFQKLIARLREKSAFKDTIAAYQARIDAYKNELDGQMRKLVEDELSRIGPTVGTMSESPRQSPTAQVEELFRRLSSELENTRDQIDSVTTAANPQYSAAVGELKSLYPKISKALKEVGKFGTGEVGRNPGMPAAQADFLREAGNRYAALVSSLEV